MIDPEELRVVEVFSDLDDDQLAWLAANARLVTANAGEVVFEEGAPTNEMIAVLAGEVRGRSEKGAPDGAVITRSAGQITGMLPLSRLTHSPITVRATIPVRAAFFSKDLFPEMLQRIPVLQLRLASIMVDRSREFTRHDDQREKLISLGKLSAGLAHELNNPAAAIQRRLEELARRLDDLSNIAKAQLEQRAAPGLLAPLWRLRDAASRGDRADAEYDTLARSDAEEALSAWLGTHDLPDAWLAAGTFVSAGVSVPELEAASAGLPPAELSPALRWLETDLAARSLVADIAEASRRIVDLIAAVKSYSNMDRAPVTSEIDVREGIRSTLAMLAHKLRSKGVRVRTEFDPGLPRVTANPGELNQVWTNLIDNAIDAVPPEGEIAVRTASADGRVTVQVIDSGPGMPAEVRARAFDPFFTTKDVGSGTGLGLDIVRRIVSAHGGAVHVDSEPGRTCFEVRFPVSATGADANANV